MLAGGWWCHRCARLGVRAAAVPSVPSLRSESLQLVIYRFLMAKGTSRLRAVGSQAPCLSQPLQRLVALSGCGLQTLGLAKGSAQSRSCES